MKKKLFAAMFGLVPFLSLQAHEIAGNYYSVYYDAGSDVPYNSIVSVEQNGENYAILWTFPDSSTEIGIGIKKDDHLSIGFISGEDVGVEVLKIKEHHLKGVWAEIGDSQQGREEWTRIE